MWQAPIATKPCIVKSSASRFFSSFMLSSDASFVAIGILFWGKFADTLAARGSASAIYPLASPLTFRMFARCPVAWVSMTVVLCERLA